MTNDERIHTLLDLRNALVEVIKAANAAHLPHISSAADSLRHDVDALI